MQQRSQLVLLLVLLQALCWQCTSNEGLPPAQHSCRGPACHMRQRRLTASEATPERPYNFMRSLDWAPLSKVLTFPDGMGTPVAKADSLCQHLVEDGLASIAVVGNGPLSQQDRAQIQASPWVIRMNYAHNLLAPEPAHVWLLRTDLLQYSHWQLEEFGLSQARVRLGSVPHVVVIGEGPQLSTAALHRFGLNTVLAPLVDIGEFSASFKPQRTNGWPGVWREGATPRTGFLAVLAAVACAPPGVKVHVYGMNFATQYYFLHDKTGEYELVHAMADRGEIVFHGPECLIELRNCGPINHAGCRAEFRNCEEFSIAQLPQHYQAWDLEYLLHTVKASATGDGKEAFLQHIWRLEQRDALLGSSPMCRIISERQPAAAGGLRVAIVGNGPLRREHRALIGEHDIVVRFNEMNSRLRGEKTDIWVVSFGEGSGGDQFFGFSQMTIAEVAEVFKAGGPAVAFIGGRVQDVRPVLRHYPKLPLDKVLYWEGYDWPFFEAYGKVHGKPLGAFATTGIKAILGMMPCMPTDAAVGVFGFNWSPRSWDGHDVALEGAIVRQLAAAGLLTIYPTACDGVRACTEAQDRHDFKADLGQLPRRRLSKRHVRRSASLEPEA